MGLLAERCVSEAGATAVAYRPAVVEDLLGILWLIVALLISAVRIYWEAQTGQVRGSELAYYLITSFVLAPVFIVLWIYRIQKYGTAVPAKMR